MHPRSRFRRACGMAVVGAPGRRPRGRTPACSPTASLGTQMQQGVWVSHRVVVRPRIVVIGQQEAVSSEIGGSFWMVENFLVSTERDARRLVPRPDAVGPAILSIGHFQILRSRSDPTE